MTEEPYPYNLPFFRRSHREVSPDGAQVAVIKDAYEISMSNPTMGLLELSNDLKIEKCSPTFLWSDDSRYLAVPQWIFGWLRPRRERLIIIDTAERAAYLSRPEFGNVMIDSFSGGVLRFTNSVTWKPLDKAMSITDIRQSYKSVPYAELK